MLTFLIVAALIVALGSGTVGVVRYVNQQKRRGLGGCATLALPVRDKLDERGLRKIKHDEVVTHDD